jgi:hypothetical protein
MATIKVLELVGVSELARRRGPGWPRHQRRCLYAGVDVLHTTAKVKDNKIVYHANVKFAFRVES